MESGQFFVEDVEEEEIPLGYRYEPKSKSQEREDQDRTVIYSFLGNKKEYADESWSVAPYFGDLQAWAMNHYIEEEGWAVVRTLGYLENKPNYEDVETDYDKTENLLRDGLLLIEKEGIRITVTVRQHSILVESAATYKDEVSKFIEGVKAVFNKRNFYRGKKLASSGRLRFLNLRERSWENIILQSDIKERIKKRTIDFFSNHELWGRFNIPLKQGVLIAGEPGTGKTLLCETIMAIAKGITCIAMKANLLPFSYFIYEIYALARDLAPSLVIIEDIELVTKSRHDFGSSVQLNVLMEILDGIEKMDGIVTIGTTNFADDIDKAITRSGRFDYVETIPLPSLEQRRELVDMFCYSIPLHEVDREYIATKAKNFTPIQIRGIIDSLCIENPDKVSVLPFPEFGKQTIDLVMATLQGQGRQRTCGFSTNHNGNIGLLSNIGNG